MPDNNPDHLPTWADDGDEGWTPATRAETFGFWGILIANAIIVVGVIYIVVQIIRRVVS